MNDKRLFINYALRSPFLDIGKAQNSILLIGMGRSGTTWAADIINHDKSYRILFEPFFPSQVKEAQNFEYIQYISPKDRVPALALDAKEILAGKPRCQWVDRDNSGILYRKRIIKDIRCNLLSGWLKTILPFLPVVFLIRHPLQVLASWRKLGWGVESLGKRSDFQIITSQPDLFRDFPQLKEIMRQINQDDLLDSIIFLWGVFHLIPFQQLEKNDAHFLFYENLLIEPQDECRKLFKYLNKSFCWEQVNQAVKRESSTNFNKRNLSKEQQLMLNGWKKEFANSEIDRANDILAMFGLDTIYDPNGYPSSDLNLNFKESLF